MVRRRDPWLRAPDADPEALALEALRAWSYMHGRGVISMRELARRAWAVVLTHGDQRANLLARGLIAHALLGRGAVLVHGGDHALSADRTRALDFTDGGWPVESKVERPK